MAELEEELFKGERECKQNISSFLKKKKTYILPVGYLTCRAK